MSRPNLVLVQSKVIGRPTNVEDGEETEIAAQVTIPLDGGWGWVVLTSSFFIIGILDGVSFTFGSLLNDMAEDLKIADSLLALVNSIAIALYYIGGPLASALINRFGFRICSMTGSIICSFSLLTTYFISNYTALLIMYGVVAGFGYGLLNMAAGLIVGFYFEKLRSVAFAIANTGSSVGVTLLSPFNSYVVSITNWRTATLMHSGFFGIAYFLSMTFRPLLSMTVMQDAGNPSRTVTYLPSFLNASMRKGVDTKTVVNTMKPTATEKMFQAVSSYNFPTAANVVEDEEAAVSTASSAVPGPSAGPVSRIMLIPNSPQGGMNERQRRTVKAMMSKVGMGDDVDLDLPQKPTKKRKCPRCCVWDSHVAENRPMYRDDAFYSGKLSKLPEYQKSMAAVQGANTGLEYQLAVTRAAAVSDLKERRGLCTMAVRRVLASMIDPRLLKTPSYLCFSLSSMFLYIGYLIPFVFIKDRGISVGIEETHCNLFVSVIAMASMTGRMLLGMVAYKINPLILSIMTYAIAGTITIFSDISYSVLYQYLYCCIFGFCTSGIATFRSLILVDLYGLDKLTSATGMVLMFQGFGSLLSTPIAGELKNKFGYTIAYYFAGSSITLSGIILIPVLVFGNREKRKKLAQTVAAVQS